MATFMMRPKRDSLAFHSRADARSVFLYSNITYAQYSYELRLSLSEHELIISFIHVS